MNIIIVQEEITAVSCLIPIGRSSLCEAGSSGWRQLGTTQEVFYNVHVQVYVACMPLTDIPQLFLPP
jgi:hypothetical protein